MSIQIIIYGAGERGRGIYNFFEKYNQGQMIWGFCDQNYEKILEIEGKKVVGFEEAISYKMPFLISLTDEKIVKQIKNRIDESGGKIIDFCKKRFNDKDNIYYYCNNGYNIEKLKTEQYTSLFCYDAMVHFEMMDIYEYLKDIYRVLIPGGKALLHHSNNTSDYKASFANAPHGRSFMSKDVFAYLAYRAGFDVLEQKVIDWGIKDLDCISLIQKPYTTKN